MLGAPVKVKTTVLCFVATYYRRARKSPQGFACTGKRFNLRRRIGEEPRQPESQGRPVDTKDFPICGRARSIITVS